MHKIHYSTAVRSNILELYTAAGIDDINMGLNEKKRKEGVQLEAFMQITNLYAQETLYIFQRHIKSKDIN